METPEATPAPQSATTLNNGKFVTVTLLEPLQRGETTIDKLTLRKPGSGELRGLNLTDLYQLDVAAILTVATRISDPVLTMAEAESLSAGDLMEIGGTIKGFFLTAAEIAARDTLMAQMTGQMGASPPSSS